MDVDSKDLSIVKVEPDLAEEDPTNEVAGTCLKINSVNFCNKRLQTVPMASISQQSTIVNSTGEAQCKDQDTALKINKDIKVEPSNTDVQLPRGTEAVRRRMALGLWSTCDIPPDVVKEEAEDDDSGPSAAERPRRDPHKYRGHITNGHLKRSGDAEETEQLKAEINSIHEDKPDEMESRCKKLVKFAIATENANIPGADTSAVAAVALRVTPHRHQAAHQINLLWKIYRMPQSAEGRLEKKRLAEKRRRERIKANPELHNAVKAKARERYYRNKPKEMSIQQKRVKQLQNRLKSKLFRERKKQLRNCALAEDLIICVDNPPLLNDPLLEREPPKRRTSKRLSKLKDVIFSFNTGTSTPVVDLSTKSYDTTNKFSNILPSCSKSTPNFNGDSTNVASTSAPLLPKKRYSRAWVSDYSSITSPSSNSDPSSISSIDSSPTESPRRHKRYNAVNKYAYDNKLMHKRIEELKKLNSKYRKQLSRLKKKNLNINKIKKINVTVDNEGENSETCEENFKDKNQLCHDVRIFYCRDDNSKMCAGKRECKTKNKKKQQKRLLTDTMFNLHKKFLREFPHHQIVYSYFCKLRPFYVLIPKLKDRETCQCRTDANMDLIIEAMHRFNIISEKKAEGVLNRFCCDSRNNVCLSRECYTCKNKRLDYKEFDNSITIPYWSWQKIKTEHVKDGQMKTTFRTVKQHVIASPKDVIKEFEKQIIPYMQHVCNIRFQFSYLKNLKQNLTRQEAVIHCDFSENYGTKYSNEIQAVHFGGSRTQITLHTGVIYFILHGERKSQCFCTLSKSLRHDASAIWAHLMPVLTFIKKNLTSVTKLHFISDSPSGQYRNRKMFYITSKLLWDFEGLEAVSWNYTEAGHRKGAHDGVLGTLKRSADLLVAQGNDIPDIDNLMAHLKRKVNNILIEEVGEGSVFQKDLLIPLSLPKFKGTMKVHQVVWNCRRPNILAMRKLSCGVDDCAISSVDCQHGHHIGFYHPDCNENIDSMNYGNPSTSRVKILSNRVIKAPHISTKRSAKKKAVKSNKILSDKQISNRVNVDDQKDIIDDHTTEEQDLPLDDSFWINLSPIGND